LHKIHNDDRIFCWLHQILCYYTHYDFNTTIHGLVRKWQSLPCLASSSLVPPTQMFERERMWIFNFGDHRFCSCSLILGSFTDMNANQLTVNICLIQLWALKVNAMYPSQNSPWLNYESHESFSTYNRHPTQPLPLIFNLQTIHSKENKPWSTSKNSWKTTILSVILPDFDPMLWHYNINLAPKQHSRLLKDVVKSLSSAQ